MLSCTGFIQQQIRLAAKRKNTASTTASAKTTIVQEKQASVSTATNYQEQNLNLTKVTTVKRTLVNKVSSQKRSPASASVYITSPSSSFHQQSPPVSVH